MSIETVREQIFKILFPYADIKRQGDCEMIDQILAIPGLRVEAEDQSLPAWDYSVPQADILDREVTRDPVTRCLPLKAVKAKEAK